MERLSNKCVQSRKIGVKYICEKMKGGIKYGR